MAEAARGAWARDLGPDLSQPELEQFLALWNRVTEVQLRPGIADRVRWAWETSGVFSVRSAYASRFIGREHDLGASFTWHSRAPLRCKFFSWLILKDRVWTSDRLARHGLPHQETCPLCSQEQESIDHLLIACVFARSVWFEVLSALGQEDRSPGPGDRLLHWCTALASGQRNRKDLNTLAMLVLWEMWKHRNAVVFDNASPSLQDILRLIVNVGREWVLAGFFHSDMSDWLARVDRRVSGEM